MVQSRRPWGGGEKKGCGQQGEPYLQAQGNMRARAQQRGSKQLRLGDLGMAAGWLRAQAVLTLTGTWVPDGGTTHWPSALSQVSVYFLESAHAR